MRFSLGCRKFPELKNRRHNGRLYATFGSPTRFHPLTAILRARSISAVRSGARSLGVPGELTRPSISGLSAGKSQRTRTHQLVLHAKRRLLETPPSPAEFQRPWGRRHSRKDL